MSETVGKLPKLTEREMRRLEQIKAGLNVSCGYWPHITGSLIEMGLVRAVGGRVASSGRVIMHATAHITPAGEALLAGFPDRDGGAA